MVQPGFDAVVVEISFIAIFVSSNSCYQEEKQGIDESVSTIEAILNENGYALVTEDPLSRGSHIKPRRLSVSFLITWKSKPDFNILGLFLFALAQIKQLYCP